MRQDSGSEPTRGGGESPHPQRIPPPEAILSPSFRGSELRPLPSYELKFLMSEEQARAIEPWLNDRFFRDPHGEPSLEGAYQTVSLYTDTPSWDVYQRAPGYRRRKFRIRRYGEHPQVFLERKSKTGDRVWKKRSAIDEATLPLLAAPASPAEWPGRWFHAQVLQRGLIPACRLMYRRHAWIGVSADGAPIRVTMDRQIRGQPCGDWSLLTVTEGRELFPGQVIFELKFRLALPAFLKQALIDFQLTPTSASKYRRCCEIWGIGAPCRGAASA
ncbi:MAG: polyphosphate polymerase domain-containing protein [Gemmataceae bacterium]|nr:polyphosphate polymerase domain-containing protein [Gemmataceae bacterium]